MRDFAFLAEQEIDDVVAVAVEVVPNVEVFPSLGTGESVGDDKVFSTDDTTSRTWKTTSAFLRNRRGREAGWHDYVAEG